MKRGYSIRSFIYERVLLLRFGCLLHDNQPEWTVKRIAEALGIR